MELRLPIGHHVDPQTQSWRQIAQNVPVYSPANQRFAEVAHGIEE
jgi:hypothetical protein